MTGGWKFAAASVIGTSHLKCATGVCQDASSCEYDSESDRLVCVVSDGAGSAAFSEDGSRLVCKEVTAFVLAAPLDVFHSKLLANDALTHVRKVLTSAAIERNAQLRDFAATMLVVLADSYCMTFWQIGDGAICFRLGGEDQYRFAFWPSKGEFANTTTFVTDPLAADELEFDSIEADVRDVALLSDGLERLALDFKAGEAHSRFFGGLFPHLYAEPIGRAEEIEARLSAFLSSDRVNDRTDDDKTLILATRELA